jgi:hypothetical protein
MLIHCQQELHTQGFSGVPTGKNPEDSNLASVEEMQWVLLYLSISQHGQNVPSCMYHIRVLTATGASSSSIGRSW